MLWHVYAGACVAMSSMQREFVCCNNMVTKQQGLIILVSLNAYCCRPILCFLCRARKFVQGCKQAVSLIAYKTIASGYTMSWYDSNMVV